MHNIRDDDDNWPEQPVGNPTSRFPGASPGTPLLPGQTTWKPNIQCGSSPHLFIGKLVNLD